MQKIKGLSDPQLGRSENNRPSITAGCVCTIGNFDGVHIGHGQLLAACRKIAIGPGLDRANANLAVISFAPHPLTVLCDIEIPIINSPEIQSSTLRDHFVDYWVVESFTKKLASIAAEDYAQMVLDALQPSAIVLGYDFHFGKGGRGSIDTFRKLCADTEIEIHTISALKNESPDSQDQTPVSSTLIRKELHDGNIATANQLLGRPYSVTGTVEKGLQRGTAMGFPTANISCDVPCILGPGIYCGWVTQIDGRETRYPMAASFGMNPTFADLKNQVLEVHIIDQQLDLYGCKVKVEFIEYLRGETKFASEDELIAQIANDVELSVERLGCKL